MRLALALIAVLALILLAVWRVSTDPVSESPQAVDALAPPVFVPPRVRDTRAIDAALPISQTPLAASEDALFEAARAGSGEAAWRLVQALSACAQSEMVTATLLENGRVDDKMRVLMEEYLVHADRFCAGSDGDFDTRRVQALKLGVVSGDVRALWAYIQSPPFTTPLAIRDAEEVRRYLHDAPTIAAHLVEQGYIEAAAALAGAYDGHSKPAQRTGGIPRLDSEGLAKLGEMRVPRLSQSLLAQAVPDDPVLAWRYANLCQTSAMYRPYCAQIERENEPFLTAKDREKALMWVEQMRPRMTREALSFMNPAASL